MSLTIPGRQGRPKICLKINQAAVLTLGLNPIAEFRKEIQNAAKEVSSKKAIALALTLLGLGLMIIGISIANSFESNDPGTLAVSAWFLIAFGACACIAGLIRMARVEKLF